MNIISIVMLLYCFSIVPQSFPAQSKIVTASQVNGSWQSKFGTFKIWALGKGRLQVEFSGVYEYKMSDGNPMANIGEGSGIATITGRIAKFKPEGAEDECLITLEFVGSGMVVKQEGICGFGNNVSAAGRYRKVETRKPKFGEN